MEICCCLVLASFRVGWIFRGCCKWDCFPDFFFMLVIGIQEGYSFLYVNLVSCHVARCVYQLQEFPGGVLGDFMYRIILPANRDVFLHLFFLFISLLYCHYHSDIKHSTECRHLTISCSWSWKKCFEFLCRVCLAIGLLCIAFIAFECVPSTHRLFVAFIMKGHCIVAFSASTEKVTRFLSLSAFKWYIASVDLHMLHLCFSGKEPTWFQ